MKEKTIPKSHNYFFSEIGPLAIGTYFIEASLKRSSGGCICLWKKTLNKEDGSSVFKIVEKCNMHKCLDFSEYWGCCGDERVFAIRDLGDEEFKPEKRKALLKSFGIYCR
jgi:hypothetical protein